MYTINKTVIGWVRDNNNNNIETSDDGLQCDWGAMWEQNLPPSQIPLSMFSDCYYILDFSPFLFSFLLLSNVFSSISCIAFSPPFHSANRSIVHVIVCRQREDIHIHVHIAKIAIHLCSIGGSQCKFISIFINLTWLIFNFNTRSISSRDGNATHKQIDQHGTKKAAAAKRAYHDEADIA